MVCDVHDWISSSGMDFNFEAEMPYVGGNGAFLRLGDLLSCFVGFSENR